MNNNVALRKELKRLQEITGIGASKTNYTFSVLNGSSPGAEAYMSKLKSFDNLKWTIIPDDLDSIQETLTPTTENNILIPKIKTEQIKKQKIIETIKEKPKKKASASFNEIQEMIEKDFG